MHYIIFVGLLVLAWPFGNLWQCTCARKADGCLSALQMTSTEEDLLSLDHYVRKTFHKTASLMANSCKAIAILGGQDREVAQLAWEYGRHVGLAFQVSHQATEACSGRRQLKGFLQTAPHQVTLAMLGKFVGIPHRGCQ